MRAGDGVCFHSKLRYFAERWPRTGGVWCVACGKRWKRVRHRYYSTLESEDGEIPKRYEAIRDSLKKQGKSAKVAKRIAAATFNKTRKPSEKPVTGKHK